MFAIDAETTGLDLYHGARPYLVTVCDDDGSVRYWEWPVDPLTRAVNPPAEDLREIKDLLRGAATWGKGFTEDVSEWHVVVGQNIRFDAKALATVGVTDWPWTQTRDTLVAAHILESNRPKNLTDLALRWLGVDIEPYEKRLQEATLKCRRIVQQARLRVKRRRKKVAAPAASDLFGTEPGGQRPEEVEPLADWAIADPGRPDMPSAKDKTWKSDGWLPRAYLGWLKEHDPAAYAADYGDDHPWWTVVAEYANADSATTLALWQVLAKEVRRRGLWALYKEGLKLLPVLCGMEDRGVTLDGGRAEELRTAYEEDVGQLAATCVGIAARYGYDLEMPRSGNNQSLRTFCFGERNYTGQPAAPSRKWLDLPPLKRSDKTGEPSLDKTVLEEYEATLPPRSRQQVFVRCLRDLRKRQTALSYMEGYDRFRLAYTQNVAPPPSPEVDAADLYVLHPSLNMTGTDTLRMSSSNPNEQNISKQENFNLRYLFGPAPGREWWSLDYENIELRIPFYLSGEQELIALFEHPERPPYYGSVHLLNFHTVYPEIWEAAAREVGPDEAGRYCKSKYKASYYQWDKNGGFCKQYGGQRAKTDATFHRDGAFDLLDSRFSRLAKLNAATVAFAEKHGYVETLPDKTVDPRRGYPLLCTRTEWGKVLPTVPLNYKVQGTAMWCTRKAMVRCEEQLAAWRKEGFDAYIVMQVHDEIDFDFPVGGAANLWRAKRLQQLMAQSGEDVGIPLRVGVSYHPRNWAEEVKLEGLS